MTKITIIINNRPYEAPKQTMGGAEIKVLGGAPGDYWLILIKGERDSSSVEDDQRIEDDEMIHLKPGMRFRVINPATFGGSYGPTTTARI